MSNNLMKVAFFPSYPICHKLRTVCGNGGIQKGQVFGFCISGVLGFFNPSVARIAYKMVSGS